MKIFNTKLYILEEMTQEDLNNLALERNTLQQENTQLKEDIKNIIEIFRKNCEDLEATEEEFDSLYRWQNE